MYSKERVNVMYKNIFAKDKDLFNSVMTKLKNVSNMTEEEKLELEEEVKELENRTEEQKKNTYWKNKYNSQQERNKLKESYRIVKEHDLEGEIEKLPEFEEWYEIQDKE